MEILCVEGVNKLFGGLWVFNNVNFLVEEGIVYVIIGFNGVGKLIFLNCLIGCFVLDIGIVMFGDILLIGMKLYEIN